MIMCIYAFLDYLTKNFIFLQGIFTGYIIVYLHACLFMRNLDFGVLISVWFNSLIICILMLPNYFLPKKY